MSSVEETYFPASFYLLLKASKETLEHNMKYSQCQQQKYKKKFNNIYLLSKLQTPGTPHTTSIPILASSKHFATGLLRNFYGPRIESSNFIKETNIAKHSKYCKQY